MKSLKKTQKFQSKAVVLKTCRKINKLGFMKLFFHDREAKSVTTTVMTERWEEETFNLYFQVESPESLHRSDGYIKKCRK